MLWINGALMLALGFLYLFAKPNINDRPYSKTLLIVGGLVVAGISAYIATQVDLSFSLLFVAEAAAVLIKTFLNWRDLPARPRE